MSTEQNKYGYRMISEGDRIKSVNTGTTGTVMHRHCHEVLVRWDDGYDSQYYVNDMSIELIDQDNPKGNTADRNRTAILSQ